jgi:hypothetical protein
MPALARTIASAQHQPVSPHPSGRRHCADEALVRLYIRFSGIYGVFVVVTLDGVAVVSRARDPNKAIENLRVGTCTRPEPNRVWWTQSAADAAIVHLAFAATSWPTEELIPAVLNFARENNIALTSDVMVQAKARNLVEWVDSDFESLRYSGGTRNFCTEELRRSKIRTLYRIAQADKGVHWAAAGSVDTRLANPACISNSMGLR